MRIAIPYEKDTGAIAEQFDQATDFKLYNLTDGKLGSSVGIPAFELGDQAMTELLQSARADVLICGGVTARARQLLGAAGIAV